MLDNLTERLGRVMKALRGEARLTEDNIQASLREVRLALLEADVALPVVRQFIAAIRDKALGQEVLSSLTPGQALIGVVQRELTALMGGTATPLNLATTPPAVYPAGGTAGRRQDDHRGQARAPVARQRRARRCCWLAATCIGPRRWSSSRRWPKNLLSTASQRRPAQSRCQSRCAALDWARKHYHDVLIVDTAGRLAIDTAMMDEIAALHAALHPIETLFVVDAMQGQDAVNTAKSFAATLPLTGIVLTKLDGDARGGAALSVRSGDRGTDQVRRRCREARWTRGLSSRAHGLAHTRHG